MTAQKLNSFIEESGLKRSKIIHEISSNSLILISFLPLGVCRPALVIPPTRRSPRIDPCVCKLSIDQNTFLSAIIKLMACISLVEMAISR